MVAKGGGSFRISPDTENRKTLHKIALAFNMTLATRLQDRAGCLEALQKILPAMGRPPKDSPLFRSVSGRNPESVAAIVRQLRSKILNNLEHDEEFAFFRGSPEYEQLRPLLEHPDQ